MVPSEVEALERLEIGSRERAFRIEHDSPIHNLGTSLAVHPQTSGVSQFSRKGTHGFLIVRHDQQSNRVTLHESIERQ
jgi:hypothetical protein